MRRSPRRSRTGLCKCFLVRGFLLAAAFFLILGCGKKAPPVAPRQAPLVAVADLQAAVQGEEVTLTWTHSAENRHATGYVVLRSRKSRDEAPCPGCPQVFKRIGSVPMDRSQRKQRQRREFTDALAPGFRYTYSVRPVGSSGAQGPDSNRVDIDLPEPAPSRPGESEP